MTVTEDLWRAIAEREDRSVDVAVDAFPTFEVRVNRARAEPLNLCRHRSLARAPQALDTFSAAVVSVTIRSAL